MPRIRTASLVFALSAALVVLFGGMAGAETVMVAARETVNGAPTQPPLSTAEAVTNGLFEAGHIVFDAGELEATAPKGDLARVAREGKAGWLLEITAAYTQSQVDKNTPTVACSATFSLVNTANGATSFSDRVSVTNAGREKSVDRAALAVELGTIISREVAKSLRSPAL